VPKVKEKTIKIRKTIPAIALAVGSLPSIARADLARQHQSFDRLVLPGGRAAMLGGAYTALSNDPSGLFYNPAGIVDGTQNQVSLNTWSTNRSEVVFKEAVKGQDYTETSNTFFGGFAGGIFHKKWITLGYVIATLDKRNINQDDYFYGISDEEGQARDFTRIHQESNSYDLFGSSMAFSMGKSWSIGGAAFYYDRSIEAMDYQQVLFNGGQVLVQESKVRVSNQGFHGSAGLQYHGENASLGFSVRVGEPILNKGSMNFNSVTHAVANTVPEVVNYSSDDYAIDTEIIPTIYRMGVAFHPAKGFLVTSDLSYSAAVEVDNGSPDRLGTWNYALGLETGFTNWRLMLGVFTNNSTFPEIQADGTNQIAHLDYIGKTIGTSILTKTFDLHLGFIRQDGRGIAQIVAGATTNQKVEATTENVLLSWTFKL
jgi:long-chain fatty acid transport protein